MIPERTLPAAGKNEKLAAAGLAVERLAVDISGARVVRDCSLNVSPGEVVGLAGRNGAGKTTSLRAISAMLPRAAGSMFINGRPLARSPAAVVRAGVVQVPEGRGIFPAMTIEQNLRIGALGAGRAGIDLDGLRAIFPQLKASNSAIAGRLSGGEQQMVALMRGLAARPAVLLVDEMSLGLAPRAVTVAIEALAEVAASQRVGMLVADQNSQLLAEYCDRLYVLRNGATTAWGGGDDLASAYFD